MSGWTTNAECAHWLNGQEATYDCLDPDDIAAFSHAAAVLSAPLVVDLPPDSTPEILTWALRIARSADAYVSAEQWIGLSNPGWIHLTNTVLSCPPHVAEALRRLT
jgi:hypothetical protein